MNRIKFTDYTGGLPLKNNDLERVEETIKGNDYEALKAITSTTNFILHGMVWTLATTTVGSGAIVHTGEIYTTTNFLTSVSDIDNVWVVSDYTYDSDGLKVYKDGVSHDTWQNRQCKYIEQVATPVGYDWYVSYSSLARYEEKLIDKVFDDYTHFFTELQTFYDSDVKTWTALSYGSGYNDGSTATPLKYTLDSLGNVNIRGLLNTTTMPKAGFIGANVAFVLPSEIRPSYDFDFIVNMNYIKTYEESAVTYYENANGIIIAQTGGNCYLTCYDTVSNTGTTFSTMINLSYKLD